MPTRDCALNSAKLSMTLRRSPRFLRTETPQQEHPTALRKSPKLSRQERGDQKSPKSRSDSAKRVNKCGSEKVSKRPKKSSEGFKKYGSKKPLVLEIGGVSNPRRSSRISVQRRENGSTERAAKRSGDSGGGNSANKKVQLRILKAESRVVSKRAEKENRRNALVRSKAIVERAKEESEKERSGIVEVFSRKRKMVECEEISGWTIEQELALHRAYLAAKPTPQFWTKVSRLVPGKSAQDCFDKLNSGYASPPQRRRVSRAKREHSPPIPHSELSASRVLKPTGPKLRKPSCNKQRTRRGTHKNSRHLVQEHYHQSQSHEVDLFSVLEPNLDVSRQPYNQQGIVLSTPKQPKEKREFRHNFNERSSSVHKKSLSRFSASHDKALTSPPVLKTLKNKVLHERYIDQLHGRDAQRRTVSELARKGSLKTNNRGENNYQKLDAVLAAKNALVSDARDAITKLQQEQSYGTSDSSDLEYDIFRGDDDESEIEM